MIEDRLLLWRFKNGNENALCRVYEKYRTCLLKLASALSNDKDLAEDVVQDVFVSLAQSVKRLRIGGNLRAYLATSVANRVRNSFRDDRSRQHISLDSADAIACNPPRGSGADMARLRVKGTQNSWSLSAF
jgi:RNA polymerase sigma factor (sigma-70 family)